MLSERAVRQKSGFARKATYAQEGFAEEKGWNNHLLEHGAYAGGTHFEFHTHDASALVAYCKRASKHMIRMAGSHDHNSIPGGR